MRQFPDPFLADIGRNKKGTVRADNIKKETVPANNIKKDKENMKEEKEFYVYNHIITEDAKKIRELARGFLKGNWKNMAVVSLIYTVLLTTVPAIIDQFTSFERTLNLGENSVSTVLNPGSSLYALIFMGVFQLGVAVLMLYFFREKTVKVDLIFSGFERFGKALALFLLMTVKIVLWCCLLIVPGIIAAFRYSQAFFILADHPEYTPNQCLKESSRLMVGNKMRYFGLLLSFIGWYLLAAIPEGIVYSICEFNSSLTAALVSLVIMIPVYFVMAYSNTAQMVFYTLLTEQLRGVKIIPRMPEEEKNTPKEPEVKTIIPEEPKEDTIITGGTEEIIITGEPEVETNISVEPKNEPINSELPGEDTKISE